MVMNEDKTIKNIIEILELAKEEIKTNNKNITATLDLEDLKSLKCLYDLYRQEKERADELKQEILQEKAKAEEYRIGWCNTGEELEQLKAKA